MIQAKKLGHIVLKVRDAAVSRDFYTRTLGLKVSHEDLAHGAVFLSFGVELRRAQGGRELKAIGVPVESTVEHNVSRSIYFRDPDGNRVELYCDNYADGFDAMRRLGPRRAPLDLE